MRTKKVKPFVRTLLNEIQAETGCSIQYNKCACNSCFHTWAETELKLNNDLAHLFWIVVLALRGDYEQDEILKGNLDNFKEIITKYGG
jgi:hypothetical protein